ncbi:MAG TPA: cyclic nucleotide-binding domain-containing protein [Candidatus Binatia bacterium]|nr:cyclic nucleotide-binding domain-containing protein [Candidatus Binatia bacterium]
MTTSAEPNRSLFRFAEDTEKLPPGHCVFKEGDPGKLMYGVKEGTVDIVVHGTVVETVGPGDFFGEMALIDHATRSASAVTRSDCELVPINEQRFTYLVQQTPFFALQLMRTLVRRLRQMDAKL